MQINNIQDDKYVHIMNMSNQTVFLIRNHLQMKDINNILLTWKNHSSHRSYKSKKVDAASVHKSLKTDSSEIDF